MAGHFAGACTYAALCWKWWWRTMYKNALDFNCGCGGCATIAGVGLSNKPSLHPIPVQRRFQIVGVDIMELPITMNRNHYIIVLQDFLTKWPLVFAVPDQKAIKIARLVAKEVLPIFGVCNTLSLTEEPSSGSCDAGYLSTCWGQEAEHHFIPPTMQQDGRTAEQDFQDHATKADGQVWRLVGSVPAWCPLGLQEHSPWVHKREAVISVGWTGPEIAN